MSSLLFEVSALRPNVLVVVFPEAGITCAVFSAALAAFPCVAMPSLVFQAILGGVSGTMDDSLVVDVSVSIGDLEMLSNSVVSFFFGAIGTSVGVVYFLGGVLTVMESLLKAALPSSSSSLQF